MARCAVEQPECRRDGQNPRAGGLYSVAIEAGSYGIAKVPRVGPEVIHVRLYKGAWPERPDHIDPAHLTVGKLGELILVSDVRDDELEGYRYWKKHDGGVWGG